MIRTNGRGKPKIQPQKTVTRLFAVGMTTIAFPGIGLGRLSAMSTAVVFSTLRDRLAGINFALTSFVCTIIIECHLLLLLAIQICQSNMSHERNCSVMLISNTPVVRTLKTTQGHTTLFVRNIFSSDSNLLAVLNHFPVRTFSLIPY